MENPYFKCDLGELFLTESPKVQVFFLLSIDKEFYQPSLKTIDIKSLKNYFLLIQRLSNDLEFESIEFDKTSNDIYFLRDFSVLEDALIFYNKIKNKLKNIKIDFF
ncbi:MAG: hypothetical protein GF329_16210 [Candidatus Lokiarchaeota archaeon]|nr:hypothetical protein [Candidatus Lokiarchaeota archaeon]